MTDRLLDRDLTVLVIVDVQERLAAAMARRDAVIDAITFLIGVARIAGVPVVVTRQYPKGLGDTEPSLLAALESNEESGAAIAHTDKVAFDCFNEPTFHAAIEGLGRCQMVIVGMESHICVTQTAVTAVTAGWDVHVVDDACCSRAQNAHDIAMARLRAAGAVVTVAESVAYELLGEAGTPEFKELLGLVKQRS